MALSTALVTCHRFNQQVDVCPGMAILVRYNSPSWSGETTMPPLFALVPALQRAGRQESDSKMFAGNGVRVANLVAKIDNSM
jgi:hypothetical protein